MLGKVEDLHMIVAEFEDHIEKLRNACPSEWGSQKKEIDGSHVNMRSKYEETMEAIGKGAPVSVPG